LVKYQLEKIIPMQVPWAWVVGDPPNGNVIACRSESDDITLRRVGVVISTLPCASDDAKFVLGETRQSTKATMAMPDCLPRADEMGAM
jgi:hypothetical protein